jgi:tRNA (cytidine32/uridine32-2'-O)-methyltransferase
MLAVTQSTLDNIRIILVNTTHPGNIGGVARAMKNMGLNQLYLVEPKEFPAEEAVWRSGHASDVLDSAVVTSTLTEAIEGCGLVIGTSARERKIPWPLMNPRETAEKVALEAQSMPVALVFGREDRGLTNDELHSCHLHLNIPTGDEYSSLNLAAAVQVVCYELRMTIIGDGLSLAKPEVPTEMREWDVPLASGAMMSHFYQHLEKTLTDIEFLDNSARRQTMPRLKRLFNRVRLDEMEVQMLRGILKSVDRKG